MARVVACPCCMHEFEIPRKPSPRESVIVARNIRRVRNPDTLSERYSVQINHDGDRFLQQVDSYELAVAVKHEVIWQWETNDPKWHEKFTESELEVIKRTYK